MHVPWVLSKPSSHQPTYRSDPSNDAFASDCFREVGPFVPEITCFPAFWLFFGDRPDFNLSEPAVRLVKAWNFKANTKRSRIFLCAASDRIRWFINIWAMLGAGINRLRVWLGSWEVCVSCGVSCSSHDRWGLDPYLAICSLFDSRLHAPRQKCIT